MPSCDQPNQDPGNGETNKHLQIYACGSRNIAHQHCTNIHFSTCAWAKLTSSTMKTKRPNNNNNHWKNNKESSNNRNSDSNHHDCLALAVGGDRSQELIGNLIAPTVAVSLCDWRMLMWHSNDGSFNVIHPNHSKPYTCTNRVAVQIAYAKHGGPCNHATHMKLFLPARLPNRPILGPLELQPSEMVGIAGYDWTIPLLVLTSNRTR